jgi:RNA polymerase sigma-70 factor (ECF subfamily)
LDTLTFEIKNKTAFEKLFLQFHERLVLYAMKFVDHREQANDLVQEVFLKLWEKKDSLSINISIQSYLFRSVYNNCVNFLEHKRTRQDYQKSARDEIKALELDYYNGEASILQMELRDAIHDAIRQLPDEYSEVIRMSRLEGYKTKEIAEYLELPVRTVETRIYRGVKLMRKMLTDLIPVFFFFV